MTDFSKSKEYKLGIMYMVSSKNHSQNFWQPPLQKYLENQLSQIENEMQKKIIIESVFCNPSNITKNLGRMGEKNVEKVFIFGSNEFQENKFILMDTDFEGKFSKRRSLNLNFENLKNSLNVN